MEPLLVAFEPSDFGSAAEVHRGLGPLKPKPLNPINRGRKVWESRAYRLRVYGFGFLGFRVRVQL